MVEPTERRWGIVTHVSVFIAMVCTFILGITGYATFTGLTQGKQGYLFNTEYVFVKRLLKSCYYTLT